MGGRRPYLTAFVSRIGVGKEVEAKRERLASPSANKDQHHRINTDLIGGLP
jgi:hypothetical protein